MLRARSRDCTIFAIEHRHGPRDLNPGRSACIPRPDHDVEVSVRALQDALDKRRVCHRVRHKGSFCSGGKPLSRDRPPCVQQRPYGWVSRWGIPSGDPRFHRVRSRRVTLPTRAVRSWIRPGFNFPLASYGLRPNSEGWIGLLQSDPERKLRSLDEIEHLSVACRRECRADNSPLTVAYDHPILRSAGLRTDRIGDCTEFFGISDEQLHHAFCSCQRRGQGYGK
jgi:hypothetical protein